VDIAAADFAYWPLTPTWQDVKLKDASILSPASLSRVGLGVPLKEAGCNCRYGVVVGFDLLSAKASYFDLFLLGRIDTLLDLM
jgi:hypothetical protein